MIVELVQLRKEPKSMLPWLIEYKNNQRRSTDKEIAQILIEYIQHRPKPKLVSDRSNDEERK